MRVTNGSFDLYVTYVNGWFPAVYMSYTSQNFRFFHASNLSDRNFRIFLLVYPGSVWLPRYCSEDHTNRLHRRRGGIERYAAENVQRFAIGC